MIDPRCYRNRCHIYSLYWASQSAPPEIPEEVCNINYTIKSLPTTDIPIPIDNTFAVDRVALGTCDLIEQIQSTLFTFTDSEGGTLDAVKIISLPVKGILTVGAVPVSAGDTILVPADFTTGLYYHSDDTTNIAYTDKMQFQVRTAETGVFSDVGNIQIDVTLCTNAGPVATDNTVPVDRVTSASCLVTEEYTDGTMFTFTDADGDLLEAVKIMSIPTNGVLRYGQFDTVEVGDILDFTESVYYVSDSGIEGAYTDTVQFQVKTEHSGVFSNTATLTFDVTLCTNTNELPVAIDNLLNIDRITTETCLINVEYTESIFTYTDTENDALNAVKIVTLPTVGTVTIGMSTVINAGDILVVPDDFNIYYHTDPTNQGSYTDTIQFSVRTDENQDFSNIADLTIEVTECLSAYTPCVTYEPHFDMTSGGIGLMDAGILLSDMATVGDYVIEWRYGSITGELRLVSASAYDIDVDINQVHPFDPPLPMESGIYYPVLRWVEIDGIVYHSDPAQGDRFGEDLIECVDLIEVLQPITVEALRCDNGVTSTLAEYDHKITYNNANNPPEAASLSSTFYLNEDETTKYIAYKFYGHQVSDQMQFSYISGATVIPLDTIIVGTDLSTTSFTTTRVERDWNVFEGVLDLRSIPYTIGDEILIEITPSYAQPTNTNTNWDLYLKCLDDIFTCDYINPLWREIDPCTVSGTFNTSACRLEVTFDMKGAHTGSNEYTYLDPRLRYLNQRENWSVTAKESRVLADFNTEAKVTNIGSPGTCTNMSSALVASKVAGDFIYDFEEEAQYISFKTELITNLSDLDANGWVDDPTNINYYKWIMSGIYIGITCGDISTVTWFSYHRKSTIVYDDVNFIVTVTPFIVTNGMTDIPCSTVYETVNGQLSSMNGEWVNDGYSVSTTIRYSDWLMGRRIYPSYNNDETIEHWQGVTYPKWNIDKVCGVPTIPWNSYSSWEYIFYKYKVGVTTTDTEDPENNFELWDKTVNGAYTSDANLWTLVYKIDNGVVTDTTCV